MGLFSIKELIKVHYCTILAESNSKHKIYFVFLIIPLAVAILSFTQKITATIDLMIAMVSMLAILIGFSINAVFLLMNGGSEEPSTDEIELFENTRNITIYSIIIGIFTLVIAGILLTGLSNDFNINGKLPLILGSSVLSFLVTHYIITLLLLPARLYVIIESVLE